MHHRVSEITRLRRCLARSHCGLASSSTPNRYQQLQYEIDPEYLFSPVNGEGKTERAIAEQFFKVNYTSRFNVGRITRPGKQGLTAAARRTRGPSAGAWRCQIDCPIRRGVAFNARAETRQPLNAALSSPDGESHSFSRTCKTSAIRD